MTSLTTVFSLGIRLLTSNKRKSFLSFSRVVAILSVVIGSMALILAFSILGGFESSLYTTTASFSAHIQIRTLNRTYVKNYHLIDSIVRSNTGIPITASAPILEREGLIRHHQYIEGISIHGSSETTLANRRFFDKSTKGRLWFSPVTPSLINNEPTTQYVQIIIGKMLASKLAAEVGDTVFLLTTSGSNINITDVQSALLSGITQPCIIVGLYESGMKQYDDIVAYIPYNSMAKVCGIDSLSSMGLDIWTNDINSSKQFAKTIEGALGYPFYTTTLQELYANMFAWIEMQKQPIPIVLGLISIVAVFNVLTTLLISVVDKSSSIAILQTLGLSPRAVMSVVVGQGVVLTVAGSVLGCLLGAGLCLLQTTYGIIRLDSGVYFIDKLPIEMQWWHYILVVGTSFLLSLIVTLIPAIFATRISPITVLRFR